MTRNGTPLAALCLGVLSVAGAFLSESVAIQALFLLAWVVGLGFLYGEAGILHPLAWFPPFFLAYSISYPLFVEFYGYPDQYLRELIPISSIALLGYSVGAGFSVRRVSIPLVQSQPSSLERKIYFPVLTACLVVLLLVLLSGALSKREVLSYVGANPILSVGMNAFVVLIVISVSIILSSGKYNSMRDLLKLRIFVLTTAVLFVAFGILGERDLLFRFVLICFLIVQSQKVASRGWYVIALVFAAFLVLPVTQGAKSFFLGGDVSLAKIAVEELLMSEFSSAARNLHYILATQFTELNGATYVWDAKRFFSFLFPGEESTTAWFNNIVRNQYGEGGTAGWGFSLVAEAYINFGLVSVFFQFLLIGAISTKAYALCRRGRYYAVFYLLYIPTLIYCLRADMANYLSLNIKQNLALVLVLSAFALASRRRRVLQSSSELMQK